MWKAVENCVRARVPAMVWGDPGIGKTARIEQMAERLGLHLEIVIASIRDPSDFAGLPVKLASATNPHDSTDTGHLVAMAPPAWAVRLREAGGGILCLDELSCATPAVQAAVLRVVQEQVVGDLRLENVAVIAAANPPETAAGGWELPSPQANRFAHFECRANVREWLDWALDQGDRALSHVAAFVQVNPTRLHALPKDEAQRGRAWPSPRTWDLAAQVLSVCPDYQGEDAQEAIAALVGTEAAIEFISWSRSLDLPDPEMILQAPKSWLPPASRGDIALASMAAVVQVVLDRPSAPRWTAALVFLAHVGNNGQPDVVLPFGRTLLNNRPAGATVPTDIGDLFGVFVEAGLIQV